MKVRGYKSELGTQSVANPTTLLIGKAIKGLVLITVIDMEATLPNSCTPLTSDKLGHTSQARELRRIHALQELPDGCSRLSMRLNNIEEMERWVLSWGVHARAVRPRALAERIRKIAAQLVWLYGEV